MKLIRRSIGALALACALPALAQQATLNIPLSGPNQFGGPTGVASQINAAILATGAKNAGTGAPTNAAGGSPFTFQEWMDTSGQPRSWKIWDGTQWVVLATLNTATHALTIPVSAGGTGCNAAAGACVDAISGWSATGLIVRSGAGSFQFRTLTGTANEITVTNGDGASGNPTVSLPPALTFTGKTVTGGTFSLPIIAQISNTGTLTLPTSTDTLVGRATTDTLTNKTLTSPAINTATIVGGTINNTPIGGTTPAAGAFTTISASTPIGIASGGTNASTASGARNALGLAIGSDVQAYDAELAALAGLTSAANKLPYFTGTGTAALADFSAFARTLLDDADAAAARGTLGAAASARTITAGTGLTGGGDLTADRTLALTNTGVAAATYNFATVTVDAQGRVTAASSGSSSSAPVGILTNAGLSASVALNALTINLTDAAGAAPSGSSIVSIPFRSATAGDGSLAQRAVNSALSLVISSGSTAGASNATPFRLWVVGFDDAGTVRICAINARSGGAVFPLQQFAIAGATAEGGAGAADSAQTFYCAASVSAKPYTVLGYLEWASGLTTAGTWDAAPTRVEIFRPGLALPGTTIQVASVTGGGSSTTSASMVDVTGGAVTITPTSAANIIEYMATARGTITAGGAGINSYYSGEFIRASTQLQAGTIAVVSGAGTNMQTEGYVAFGGIDQPNTTSATTYKFRHSRIGGGTATTGTANAVIREIQS